MITIIGVALVLNGCTSWMKKPVNTLVLAKPLTANVDIQIQLVRINQILSSGKKLTPSVAAKLFYERGMTYDAMGLNALALMDFRHSLGINPIQPEIFNVLGIYYTQVGRFTDAYDAFDSVIDLDPKHPYAYRNRGIALYYGKRISLAIETFSQGYAKHPDDPFSLIWLYLAMAQKDPYQAHQYLVTEYKKVAKEEDPGWLLVPLLIDDASDTDILRGYEVAAKSERNLAYHLCEIYFYIAKREQLKGHIDTAKQYFKLALMTHVMPYLEHRYATLELNQIANKITKR